LLVAALQLCALEIRGFAPDSLSSVLPLHEGAVNRARRVALELAEGFRRAALTDSLGGNNPRVKKTFFFF